MTEVWICTGLVVAALAGVLISSRRKRAKAEIARILRDWAQDDPIKRLIGSYIALAKNPCSHEDFVSLAGCAIAQLSSVHDVEWLLSILHSGVRIHVPSIGVSESGRVAEMLEGFLLKVETLRRDQDDLLEARYSEKIKLAEELRDQGRLGEAILVLRGGWHDRLESVFRFRDYAEHAMNSIDPVDILAADNLLTQLETDLELAQQVVSAGDHNQVAALRIQVERQRAELTIRMNESRDEAFGEVLKKVHDCINETVAADMQRLKSLVSSVDRLAVNWGLMTADEEHQWNRAHDELMRAFAERKWKIDQIAEETARLTEIDRVHAELPQCLSTLERIMHKIAKARTRAELETAAADLIKIDDLDLSLLSVAEQHRVSDQLKGVHDAIAEAQARIEQEVRARYNKKANEAIARFRQRIENGRGRCDVKSITGGFATIDPRFLDIPQLQYYEASIGIAIGKLNSEEQLLEWMNHLAETPKTGLEV